MCTWTNPSAYSPGATPQWYIQGVGYGYPFPSSTIAVGEGQFDVYLHLTAPGYAPVNSVVLNLP